MTENDILKFNKGGNCSNMRFIKDRIDGTGQKNYTYYKNTLKSRLDIDVAEIENLNIDRRTKNKLNEYLKDLTRLQAEIIELIIKTCDYETRMRSLSKQKLNGLVTPIHLKMHEIEHRFVVLEYQKSFINSLVENNEISLAIKVKDISIDRINRFVLFFKQWYNIDFSKTIIEDKLLHLKNEISNSINIEELKLLKDYPDSKATKKFEVYKDDLVGKSILEISKRGKSIISVYNELKLNWLDNNKGKTEIDFIDSFDFSIGYDSDTIDKSQFTNEQLTVIKELSTFLGKHRGTIVKTPNDHYNQYLKNKRFGFMFLRTYKRNEFQGFIEKLSEFKERYFFIQNKLPLNDQIELKGDFCDQLDRLSKLQNHSKFKEVINDAISEIEAEYLKNNEPQSKEVDTDKVNNSLLPNAYPKIFSNDFGYNLFNEMHAYYKTEKTYLANYSFLFYAMENDYLVCSQSEFVEFLGNEKYNIQIDKIDSRQSGENKKSKLYDSTKDRLQKKHDISTI